MKYGIMSHEDGHMKMYDLSVVAQCLKYLKEEKKSLNYILWWFSVEFLLSNAIHGLITVLFPIYYCSADHLYTDFSFFGYLLV